MRSPGGQRRPGCRLHSETGRRPERPVHQNGRPLVEQQAICTEGLTCQFGSLIAVDHLDLSVPRGVVFGFLGPNGAGKTTTIRMLLALLEPSEGSATVLGYDIATQGQAIRERTGALTEHTGLYDRLTAEENLEYAGRIYRLPPAVRKQRSRELLTHPAGRGPGHLCRGGPGCQHASDGPGSGCHLRAGGRWADWTDRSGLQSPSHPAPRCGAPRATRAGVAPSVERQASRSESRKSQAAGGSSCRRPRLGRWPL